MACFLVPAGEAVITTVLEKTIERKECAHKELSGELPENRQGEHRVPFSRKLKWLNTMLWGGSALLAFEHFWHGEVVPYFPFLSAMSSPQDTAEMLHEMGTVGVSMALIVSVAWAGLAVLSNVLEKRSSGIAETDGSLREGGTGE